MLHAISQRWAITYYWIAIRLFYAVNYSRGSSGNDDYDRGGVNKTRPSSSGWLINRTLRIPMRETHAGSEIHVAIPRSQEFVQPKRAAAAFRSRRRNWPRSSMRASPFAPCLLAEWRFCANCDYNKSAAESTKSTDQSAERRNVSL